MKYSVTIGIPVYNIEKYIRVGLESALAQTFPDIEFLILDDCGTDSSMDIVREYQQSHPRGGDIHILRQPHNMGIGKGRNRIISEAQGQYLYFLDADDTIAPNTIELLYNAARKYDAELVYGSYERVDMRSGNEERTVCRYDSRQFLRPDEYATWVYRKYEGIQATVWNMLIDVNVYRSNGLSFQAVNYWEDFMLTIDLPTYVTRVVLLPDITYSYYLRLGSASKFQERSKISKSELENTINGMNKIKDNSQRIAGKSYFPLRMKKVMTTCYFVANTIVHNSGIITPSFSNEEIRDVMRSPLSFAQILSFRQARLQNLVFYALGKMPSPATVLLLRAIGDLKKLL
mgnify:CR=1 FL=1